MILSQASGTDQQLVWIVMASILVVYKDNVRIILADLSLAVV